MSNRFRLSILILFVFGGFSFLIFNLYNLQIQRGEYYSAKADSQHRLADILEASRGNIYFTDKNNNQIPVATNKSYPVVFAVPKEIDDLEEAVQSLLPILNIKEEELRSALQEKDSHYKLLSKKSSTDQVNKVNELELKGIYIGEQESRFYPFNSLAAQLLGYVGPDDGGGFVGKYGLELFYDDKLTGSPGEDLILTIDRNIQAEAEEIITNLVKKFNAARGSVIVQEPKTGKILAMGDYPSFDPNNYSKASLSSFLNQNIQSIYEPGSIFKVFTMAAGFDSGAITPDTSYYDTGELKVRDRTIRNWDLKSYGNMTMTQVIEHSLNIGAAFAEKKTGNKTFYDYLLKFGFSKPTQIDLPGEVTGNLRNLSEDMNNPVNFATASFGQGISVTTLQLIGAISSIANGGYLMRPIILTKDEPEEVEQVITKDTAQKVTAMMENALNKAEIGKVEKYRLAGKTGTAQLAGKGGYTSDVINTYVGFGPVSDPKFTILFRLEKPARAPLAGQTVVPAFRELAQFILNYYNIPPDGL